MNITIIPLYTKFYTVIIWYELSFQAFAMVIPVN